MSHQARVETREMPASEQRHYDTRAAALRARRIAAIRVRRRRLLAIDLSLAVALAVFGLIVAPGLAILALFALLVLGGCGAWIAVERIRVMRAARAARQRPGPRRG